MSYKPIHAWKRKDQLPSKDPQKIIYGEQLQDEFDAISGELAHHSGQIDQIKDDIENLPDYVEEAPQNGTVYGRANAEWVPVVSGGGGTGGHLVFWDELLEKPEGISALGYENAVDGGTYGKSIV